MRRRGHLTLVRSIVLSRSFCAADRTKLINAVQVVTGRQFGRPVEALRACIEALGFQLRKGPLPPEQLACLDLASRSVWLCSRLSAKLNRPEPEVVRAVAAFSLAHELGHIRLHQNEIVAGTMTAQHETEADRYAGAFLVPRRLVVEHPAFANLAPDKPEAKLWEAVGELAAWLGVSRACMAYQLESMGFLVVCERTKRIKVA